MQLGTMRPIGGLTGPSRIPWETIINYGKHYGLSFDELETLVDLIGEMDALVLSKQEENDQKTRQSGTKTKGK